MFCDVDGVAAADAGGGVGGGAVDGAVGVLR